MFEQVGLSTVPSLLIIIFNLALLARVIWQKYKVHRSPQWKKQRKLAIQVFLMSSFYLVFSLPLTTIYLARLCCQPNWANQLLSIYFFLSYFVIFLLPFVSLAGLPELWNRVNRINPQISYNW